MFHSLLAATLLLASPFASAQKPEFKFQPGQWQIDSIVTMPTGQNISHHTTVCASKISDLAHQTELSKQCDDPGITYLPHGIQVQLACHGVNGPVSWTSRSSITEIFSNSGDVFTAGGTNRTTTTIPSRDPITSKVSIRSHGHNAGACSN